MYNSKVVDVQFLVVDRRGRRKDWREFLTRFLNLLLVDTHGIALVLFQDGAYAQESDMDGLGLCPYDPRHNSTAVFVGELHSNVSPYLFSVETSRWKERPRE